MRTSRNIINIIMPCRCMPFVCVPSVGGQPAVQRAVPPQRSSLLFWTTQFPQLAGRIPATSYLVVRSASPGRPGRADLTIWLATDYTYELVIPGINDYASFS